MSKIIIDTSSMGERMHWRHGEYSGTITFPGEERGPVDIQWDNFSLPDEWELIEEVVEAEAAKLFPPMSVRLAGTPIPATVGQIIEQLLKLPKDLPCFFRPKYHGTVHYTDNVPVRANGISEMHPNQDLYPEEPREYVAFLC